MSRPSIIAAIFAAVVTAFVGDASGAWSASTNGQAMTEKECGSCHMAYLPQFLPERSWQALMAGLNNHFGENASLDPNTSKVILDYLTQHAADRPGQDNRFLRGLADSVTPLRISDTPYWIRRHSEIPAEVFTHPKVQSKSNCGACHQDAAKGGFEDE
jgi:mono/diheme cytochrome c family protein